MGIVGRMACDFFLFLFTCVLACRTRFFDRYGLASMPFLFVPSLELTLRARAKTRRL